MVALTEAQYQDRIVDLARMLGWIVCHFRPARTEHGWATAVKYDGAGFPDLVLLHPRGHLIFAEVKSDTGRLSTDQVKWGDAFRSAIAADNETHFRYVVWRPRDWPEVMVALQAPRLQ